MNAHRIYLLRIWAEAREGVSDMASWRMTLEEPHTGRRWGFTEPKALVAFLEALIEKGGGEEPEKPPRP